MVENIESIFNYVYAVEAREFVKNKKYAALIPTSLFPNGAPLVNDAGKRAYFALRLRGQKNIDAWEKRVAEIDAKYQAREDTND
ncbi:hypothetical protein [Marinobacter sp.]|uniref:hypothetical protein n=1 Tax=Marinobacter sp. TaxID=50741 RepID=UPI000C8BA620|nr:hypothetical protein [Marinobacter sp.]MAB53461.1 hypothetical protein [Marinobacter sp.]